jgi:hypothetical protein
MYRSGRHFDRGFFRIECELICVPVKQLQGRPSLDHPDPDGKTTHHGTGTHRILPAGTSRYFSWHAAQASEIVPLSSTMASRFLDCAAL